MAERETVRVVAINGSLREISYTRMALKIALRGADAMDAQTHLIDLREYDLPFCDANEDRYPRDVFRLRDDVGSAQGIILGTPVYHGGYSGVLKNALDLMGSNEFRGKIVGVVGAAGGGSGELALNGLQTIGRSLHGWVVPQQAVISKARDLFLDDGTLTDLKLENRLLQVGRQVARFAYLHHAQQSHEFMQLWEESLRKAAGV